MNNVNLVKMKVEGSSKSHSRADIISRDVESVIDLSLIHISEPTRR